MEPDFSGYATKADLECSDGRTISAAAFKHMHGMTVPLVWQHGHSNPENVLGHALLEVVADGVRAHGFFNDTKAGQQSKALVEHKDITKMSIYANHLKEAAKRVMHGMIQEVSLVISAANPGAKIDFVNLRHADGTMEELEDEAVIHTGLDFDDDDVEDESLEHADGETIGDVYDSLTDKQKQVLIYMLGVALEAQADGAAHSDTTEGTTTEGAATEGSGTEATPTEGEPLTHQEGTVVHRNAFDQTDAGTATGERHVLSHSDMQGILKDAKRPGQTLKSAVDAYALAHGITNIDTLFPEARTLSNTPEFNKRRTEWVAGVLNGVRHSPFSRVKSLVADITQDEARARGYIKGSFKKEEWFSVTGRTTSPTTIYKKQKLDRDDIVDITDFDVVAFMKGEMRLMLEEEIATAILIGDGRDVSDEDKIKDPVGATDGVGVRSILNDHELYVTTVNVNISDSSSSYYEVFEAILRNRKFYRGTGQPTLYTTQKHITELLLCKDGNLRRYWQNKAELANDLDVAAIVAVETMERLPNLVGIMVNLQDYNVGNDRGGEVSLFDDFDIDYNQFKYLMETRLSGALVKIKSALVIQSVASTKALVDPITAPTFVEATGVVTIPTQTGVTYKNFDTSATLTAGAQSALAAGASLHVIAVADSTHYFATNAEDEWTFTRPAA